jgi:TRAP-type uncharacterized transport system substrate-binding protein
LIALAEAVAEGEIDVAWVNPSGLLTQAYRGTGLFSMPLDLRVLAIFPSRDRFACAVHPRTGLKSLADISERQYPLTLSIRADESHGTRVLIDQGLARLGYTLRDLERWGGELVLCGRPHEPARLQALRDQTVDAVWDEGIGGWLPIALENGYKLLELGEPVIQHLEAIGWRRAPISPDRFPGLEREFTGMDFSGWALYARASLEEELAYRFCQAIADREDQMPWEDSYGGLGHLGQDTDATPRDVPLHPGAARWYREHGYEVGD